ncbi:MAG TPA: fluoride efflux transporter CrcB [candidate division Zixibacteria bacterium]|jgi:CrcB protein|nr:fluoride efflux transporter CrcB [candidate division Zixibacteria bacterium]
MGQLLLIAAGGMAGTLARYGLSRLVLRHVNDVFPWGTLAVNLSGSLLIGALYELFDRALVPPHLRSLAAIGFLGAFTTFSTFSLETVNMLREGEIRLGLANVLLNTVLGLALVVIGMHGARLMLKLVR